MCNDLEFEAIYAGGKRPSIQQVWTDDSFKNKIKLSDALPSNQYCQHSGVKLITPTVIEQIKTIIDTGGPYYVYFGNKWIIQTWYIGLFERNTQDDLKFMAFHSAENECERLNADYVAKAILKCLQQAPLDFKSVYDKKLWIETIEGMISK